MSPTSSIPPRVRPKLSGRNGFSLVEVVIAIGVIAFALISIIGVLGISLKAHEDSSVDSVFSIMTETALQEVRNDNTSLVSLAGGASGAYNFNTKFGTYTGYLYFDEDGQITQDAARKASTTTMPTSIATPNTTTLSTEMGIDVSQPISYNPTNGGNQGVPLTTKVITGLPATTYYMCTITTLPAQNSNGTTSASMYLVKLIFTWPGNSTGRVIFSSISNNTN